ncbi:GNAT family N-acetyltransferase, partial [Synechococcus sp. AH-779-G23]|nr:GNAT family N-acetyltransferase [Synechococcus sp. AH-779-G23]
MNLEELTFLAVILLSKGREVNLRPLHPLDETDLSRLIRAALVEFGADRPGFAWQDPELDAMSKTYAASGSIYLVAVEGGNIL